MPTTSMKLSDILSAFRHNAEREDINHSLLLSSHQTTTLFTSEYVREVLFFVNNLYSYAHCLSSI